MNQNHKKWGKGLTAAAILGTLAFCTYNNSSDIGNILETQKKTENRIKIDRENYVTKEEAKDYVNKSEITDFVTQEDLNAQITPLQESYNQHIKTQATLDAQQNKAIQEAKIAAEKALNDAKNAQKTADAGIISANKANKRLDNIEPVVKKHTKQIETLEDTVKQHGITLKVHEKRLDGHDKDIEILQSYHKDDSKSPDKPVPASKPEGQKPGAKTPKVDNSKVLATNVTALLDKPDSNYFLRLKGNSLGYKLDNAQGKLDTITTDFLKEMFPGSIYVVQDQNDNPYILISNQPIQEATGYKTSATRDPYEVMTKIATDNFQSKVDSYAKGKTVDLSDLLAKEGFLFKTYQNIKNKLERIKGPYAPTNVDEFKLGEEKSKSYTTSGQKKTLDYVLNSLNQNYTATVLYSDNNNNNIIESREPTAIVFQPIDGNVPVFAYKNKLVIGSAYADQNDGGNGGGSGSGNGGGSSDGGVGGGASGGSGGL